MAVAGAEVVVASHQGVCTGAFWLDGTSHLKVEWRAALPDPNIREMQIGFGRTAAVWSVCVCKLCQQKVSTYLPCYEPVVCNWG